MEKADGLDDDGDPVPGAFNGNRIPEVPWHVAALTLGVEQKTGWRWNASATWTYRGSFFTDAANTLGVRLARWNARGRSSARSRRPAKPAGCRASGCLSARFNLDIGNTGASVFVSGDNLLDELYITDREDGMKPGQGRTVWAGFSYKF